MTDVSHHAYNPCPICSGEDYTWGVAAAKGSQVQVVFKYRKPPLEATRGFEERAIGKTSVEGEMLTRRCNICGNVQYFAVIAPGGRKKKRGG